jgi:hypothetical protein
MSTRPFLSTAVAAFILTMVVVACGEPASPVVCWSKPVLGDAIHCGGRNDAAEGSRCPET